MSVLAPDSRLLTVRETAERLTVSEKTVRRLIGAGIMPAVRVSAGAIRVERDELEEWLAERRTTETAVGDSGAAVGATPCLFSTSVLAVVARVQTEDAVLPVNESSHGNATPKSQHARHEVAGATGWHGQRRSGAMAIAACCVAVEVRCRHITSTRWKMAVIRSRCRTW